MPCIEYVPHVFRGSSERQLQQANAIIAEYAAQGFTLTLRQLYYQFVARGFIENNLKSYKALGALVNDGRLAGRIDWNAIEDRTRNLMQMRTWDGPRDRLNSAAETYCEDVWADQPYYVECWIEKEALAGVFAGACDALRVPYFSCRGYVSQSEMWAAGRRFRDLGRTGHQILVLHFGDHDPSGIDMSRDIQERLKLFAERWVQVKRIALNRDQVDAYDPPSNPAKVTDSRCAGYIREHGKESWELDALDPPTLVALLQAEVNAVLNHRRWERSLQREERNRQAIREAAEAFGT